MSLARHLEIENTDLHSIFYPNQGDVEYGMGKEALTDGGQSQSYINRKLRLESFIEVDTADFRLIVNPAFNFELGMDRMDTSNERLYVNTRGVSVHGSIGKNVSFYSRFYENQAFLPSYLDNFEAQYDVIPGQGRTKTFKTTGYDYAMASGVISFSPNKRLNIQLGNGKHHLGDGYRSLALSNNAFNYPFLKVSSCFGPFQYTNLFMGLQNLHVELPTSAQTEERYQRKIATMHHLDWVVNKKLTIGVFEQMIWAKSSSKGKFKMNTDAISFVNPIIFVRPLQYGMADENNVLVGMNAKLRWPKKTEFYSQIVVDDPKSNKSGFQIGVKTWAVKKLVIRAEFNRVLPLTYTHIDSTRNFTHYNQALAHPAGAGFAEASLSFSYYLKDFFFIFRLNNIYYDSDIRTEIMKSDTSFTEIVGPLVGLPLSFYQHIKLGYQINVKTGMQVALGFINRDARSLWENDKMQYFYLSFSTNIIRRSYDF
ncbi:MAG: hypothetical protein JKX73_02005 [Flavobacteriales bacterium]|nr:hypothetical protein [Flavobacteriales bacterium]